MRKLFSLQIIKQAAARVWVWALLSVVSQSFNFLLMPSEIEKGADKSELLTLFAKDCLVLNGLVFMMIISLVCINTLITSEVEKGTLSIMLNTPTTRKQILLSKLLVFVLVFVGICVAIGLIGTVSPLMYGLGSQLSFASWWKAVALWFMYSIFTGSIVFAFGCWFNKGRYAIAVSAIILGAFFMLGMLAETKSFSFFKYLTPQTLFAVDAVIKGKSIVWQLVIMPLAAIPFYVVGIVKFIKKDLPI